MSAYLLNLIPWFLVLLGFLCVVRLILGPTTGDRLVALNVLSGLVLAYLVLQGVIKGRALYLDVALVYDIFGFLGFLAIAHFLRKKISED